MSMPDFRISKDWKAQERLIAIAMIARNLMMLTEAGEEEPLNQKELFSVFQLFGMIAVDDAKSLNEHRPKIEPLICDHELTDEEVVIINDAMNILVQAIARNN